MKKEASELQLLCRFVLLPKKIKSLCPYCLCGTGGKEKRKGENKEWEAWYRSTPERHQGRRRKCRRVDGGKKKRKKKRRVWVLRMKGKREKEITKAGSFSVAAFRSLLPLAEATAPTSFLWRLTRFPAGVLGQLRLRMAITSLGSERAC